ncbi:anti-anti-sigma factor [Saccharopolyspora antimicrobica]|uniref:Anti-sigma factor antagonist n=1 Tax=Saccharopolyspora antimicrobica TaxID=455193 RepID=A0A1I5KXX1_9PSEU|nr:anti-anti-sigma factor [Saccharopolyspora antimicrobica]SFO89939.1 anti-anti-sigma factor [Saccharopolyspora antimicrobica]
MGDMSTFTGSSEPAAPLSVATRWLDRVLLMEVAGEIELINAPRVESAIMEAFDERPAALILDFSGVTFLSSAGLAVLVRSRNRAGDDIAFRVVVDGPATARPIQLTGLDQEIEVFSTRDQAVAVDAGS